MNIPSASSKTFLVGMVATQKSVDAAVLDEHGSIVERWVETIDDAGFARCAVRLRKWESISIVFAWDGGRCLCAMNALRCAGFAVALLHSEVSSAFAARTGDALSSALVTRCVHETAPVLLPLPVEKMQDYCEAAARLLQQRQVLVEQKNRLAGASVESASTIRAYIDWLVDEIADGEQQMQRLVKATEEWLNREHRARKSRAAVGPAWADKCVLDVRLEDFL